MFMAPVAFSVEFEAFPAASPIEVPTTPLEVEVTTPALAAAVQLIAFAIKFANVQHWLHHDRHATPNQPRSGSTQGPQSGS